LPFAMIAHRERTDVWVSSSVQSLSHINSGTQTFALDVWVNCLYHDPKVKSDAGNFFKGQYIDPDTAKSVLDWDSLPVFHWINNREPPTEADQIIVIYDEPSTGQVAVQRRYIMTFFEPAEVHAFPFDEQKLRAKLFFSPCYRLHESEHMRTSVFGSGVQSNEWSVVKAEDGHARITERQYSFKGASGLEYTGYEIEMEVKRKPGQYLWSYVLPISVLTLLGMPTFQIERSELGDRLAGVITLLLTMSAIKIVVNSSTPAVNYLTSLDRFLIYTFVLVALAGVESAFAAAPELDEQFREDLDKYSFRAYFIIWVLIHPIAWCHVQMGKRKAMQKDSKTAVAGVVVGSEGESLLAAET